MMIRVLIADQAMFICDSIRAMLAEHDSFYVIGCASETDELRFLLPQSDIVLLGVNFSPGNTVGLIDEIVKANEGAKCIVVGAPDSPPQIVEFVEAGASGYILEDESAADLIRNLQAAVNDRALISDKVAAALMKHINDLATSSLHSNGNGKTEIEPLTPRQQEVMELVSEGLTNKEIAEKLYIQCGTVKNHVHHILKKLGVSNRHEASYVYQKTYHTNGSGADSNGDGRYPKRIRQQRSGMQIT